MNPKLIVITYLNNGNIESQVAKEHLFNQVVEDLIEEGRLVEGSILRQFDKRISFDDGSKVICVPFSLANRGMRFTEVYVDEALQNIANGKEAVYEWVSLAMIDRNFDLSDEKRAFTFSMKDGHVETKNIQ